MEARCQFVFTVTADSLAPIVAAVKKTLVNRDYSVRVSRNRAWSCVRRNDWPYPALISGIINLVKVATHPSKHSGGHELLASFPPLL
jgi:hypothetical protein